jgi:dipeptidyl aminopeptidase/acylaminoacyl peptidase
VFDRRAALEVMAGTGKEMHMTTAEYHTDTRQRGLEPEDALLIRELSEVALSSDGRQLAYVVRQADAERNGYTAWLYVRDLAESGAQRVSPTDGQASSPTWSPDGQHLAYSWQDGAGAAVCLWSAASGETTTVRLDGSPMSELTWRPDGQHLAGVRWTPMRQAAAARPRPGVPAPTMRVITRLRYKQDGVGYVHDRYRQVWVLEVASGELVQLTDRELDCGEPSWSQAGDRLAFVGMAREQNEELGPGQIFVVGYPHGTPERLLPEWVGACHSPVWGAQDRQIAFAGHQHPVPTNRRIFQKPYLAEVAERRAWELTPGIDQKLGQSLSNVTVQWPAGGTWIYFLLTERGATHLYRVSTAGEAERLVGEDVVVFAYSATDGQVAYGQGDPLSPGELYVWQEGAGSTGPLSDLNPWLRERWLAEPAEYWYDGLEGAKVHAWLMRPKDFDDTQQYPTVLQVHCSLFTLAFNHEFQCLASAGFAVAYFNQRGTTAGYGQQSALGNYYGKHIDEYNEIMLGVDDLLRRSYIDGERLGVTGGSCGGFMTNWIIGHTDRFEAAVTQRSITNLISKFGTTDNGPEQAESDGAGTPWSNVRRFWESSPIAYAHQIHTPLLIEHADLDHRCALEQAEQLFAALRWLGREVELVIFEGESHGMSRRGRPGNRIERLHRMIGWFKKHLGTEPTI